MESSFILAAKRTPIGSFLGSLKSITSPKLAAVCIKAIMQENKLAANAVEEIIMGCVLSAGVGQAPARQAALYGGLNKSVRATTVNRVCGSGLKAVMMADQMIRCHDAQLVLAGGMESMSLSPFFVDRLRGGFRMGNASIKDSMIWDGLWDPYTDKHMGSCAETCAKEKNISRQEQDRFAKQSYERALAAVSSGFFKKETVGIEVSRDKVNFIFDADEEPQKVNLDKLIELKPAFEKEGTITAANASTLADGAACLLMGSESMARQLCLKPMARIVAQASYADSPEWFTTAPVGAIKNVLKKANLSVSEIDLWEINEAFALVTLICARELEISEDKINIWGGAVSLGHPIGASGARILTTLVHSLTHYKKRFGLATLCIGGGEGSAVVIENLMQ